MARHMAFMGCSILLAIGLLSGAIAESDYKVGDRFGWNVPPNQSFYSDWAATRNFFVGDKLTFDWTGNHTLGDVSKTEYDNCAHTASVLIGNVTVSLQQPGLRYFICTIDDHCERGQKFSISVKSPNSTAQPSNSSAPTLSFGVLSACLSTTALFFFTGI